MATMSVDEIKALTRRLVEEFLNKGNTAVANEILTPDFVYHAAKPPYTPDREGAIQDMKDTRTVFPDSRMTIDDMIVEGDKVAIRLTMRGTHERDYMGIPATHKQVEYPAIVLLWLKDGKVTDWWTYADDLGFLQQLGTFPQGFVGQQPQVSSAQARP